MTPRVLALACLLTPLHAYWIVKTEVVWAFVHATVLSLFFNVVGCLFFLVLLNRLAARFAPRLALGRGELVCLYVLLCAATALFGHDFLQILAMMLIYPYWKMGEGAWDDPVKQHLPSWLVVTDKEALKGVWLGNASLYDLAVLKAWAVPLLVWLVFTLALLWTMLCATSLLRRRWTEHERLSFPLVQIPLELLCHHERLFASRLFWGAFLGAAGLDLWNALATAYPSLPSVNLRMDLAPFFTRRPWNEMGWTPLCLYPFAVGLAYFMPLDLAFSAWIFFWIWKAQMVVRAAMGMEPMTGAYLGDQSSGAWLGIGLMALWGARRYAAWAVRAALRDRHRADDRREAMTYRTSIVGLLAGFCLLVGFAWLIGISLWAALCFFLLFFVFCAAATRMRAEFGPATHDLYFSGPERVMTVVGGTGPYSVRDLALIAQFHWITRDFRSSPMPHQLEGLKLGAEANTRLRSFVLPVMCVSAWAFIAWFWCWLHVMYERGAIVRVAHPGGGWTLLATESYRRLDQWLTAANRGPDFKVWPQMGGGLAVTVLLLFLRQRFLWFPFHPVGYALAGSWTMSWLWCSVMAGWAAKGLLLRYGGVGTYRRAAPFFVGLVLGEFVVGGGLSLLNALTDHITYGFFP
jgi:hypothetical protein